MDNCGLLCRKSAIVAYYNRHQQLLHGLIIVFVTFLLYQNVAGHEFIINWDDGAYITENSDIAGFTRQNLYRIFTTYYQGNYAPVHLLSYMIDHALWGIRPATVKAINVLLHICGTLIFYKLLVRCKLSPLQALCAALIFAIHPVQVESVVWAAQRKNPLSLCFFLSSWYAWVEYRGSGSRAKWVWYVSSLLLFVLALLTKSVAVILPLFLVAHELYLDGKSATAQLFITKLPYVLLACVCFAVALTSQQQGGARMPYLGGSFAVTMLNMLPVFSRYLILLLWPTGLSIIYNAPIKSTFDTGLLLNGIVLVLFVCGMMRIRTSHPTHFFWLLLFVSGLLPVANVIPIVTMMNDRYLYYPMLGCAPFAVLAICGGAAQIRRLGSRLQAVVASGVLVTLFIMSWQRIDVWKNPLTLWSATLATAEPGTWYGMDANYLNSMYAGALTIRAQDLTAQGDYAAANIYYNRALDYDSTAYEALTGISKNYINMAMPLPARMYLQRLVASYKRSDEGFYLLGVTFTMTGELLRGAEFFRMALAVNPQHELAAFKLKSIEGLSKILP